MATSTACAARDLPERPGRGVRNLLVTASVFAITTLLALTGTGISYALWNGATEINASTVSSGSTSLTINGSTDYTITNLNARDLSPGKSVVTSEPIAITNTGTTALSVTIPSTTVVSQTNAIVDELTITIAADGTCSTGLTSVNGSITGRMATFTSTPYPITLAAGATLPLCLEVGMDADAPAAVQGGAATFTMNVDAAQVR